MQVKRCIGRLVTPAPAAAEFIGNLMLIRYIVLLTIDSGGYFQPHDVRN